MCLLGAIWLTATPSSASAGGELSLSRCPCRSGFFSSFLKEYRKITWRGVPDDDHVAS